MQLGTLITEPAARTANKTEKVWPRVFVVEPEYSTAIALKAALENEGDTWVQYDVMITNGAIKSPTDARLILRQAVDWQADIIIMDYLEVSCADWLVEQLKKLPSPPIVILTSHHASKIQTSRLKDSLQRQYGVEDYLRKPFSPHRVVTIVNDFWLPKTVLA